MKKISLTQLALEFISVVFAVLLALGLNSYKQSRDTAREARQLKAVILTECQNNLSKIDSILTDNKEYVDYLDSIVRLEPEEIDGFYFTFEHQLLTNGAWQIAQNNSAINSLDQDFLMEVADIYHAQDFFLDFSSQAFQNVGVLLSNKDQLSDANMALSMYYSIHVIINSAEDLQKDYRKLLKKHDS